MNRSNPHIIEVIPIKATINGPSYDPIEIKFAF